MATPGEDAAEIMGGLMGGPTLPASEGEGDDEGESSDPRMTGARLMAGEMLEAFQANNVDALARLLLDLGDL